ncbi:MAG: HAMP domain-containing protein [Chloroflexi bacterium]|nr:HAMP domain-containing protein [Chloroflexota bacterium]
MTLSLRWRLTLSLAAVVLFVVVGVFGSLRLILHDILSGNIDEDLSAQTQQVVAQIALAGELNVANMDRVELSRLTETSSFPVLILDLDGGVIASSSAIPIADLALTDSERESVLAGAVVEDNVDVGGEPHRVHASRLAIGFEIVGIVQVGESTEALRDVDSAVEAIALAAGVIGLVLALGAGFWIAQSNLRPINRVTTVAREIEASDLSRRIDADGEPVEVQRLADTFDAMLERLQRAFEAQRNFVLDMSHELRTPLTALRGNIDVFLMEPDIDEEVQRTLVRMKAEVDRLIRLTTNLLYLAHADAGREVARRPVELDALCLEVCDQMRYLRNDVTLTVGRKEPVSILGDRDLLKQTLINLIDNALKHTAAGGSVELSVFPTEHEAVIQVADTGAGIEPEQLPRIFERLHRAEGGSRSAGAGAGIGLTISQWIASVHGGEIRVESELGVGSVFTIVLPLDSAAGVSSGGGTVEAAEEVPPADQDRSH